MPMSLNDKAVIQACFMEKGWRGKKICKEFPGKKWKPRQVNHVIAKLSKTGTIDRKKGSGRKRTARTEEHIEDVREL